MRKTSRNNALWAYLEANGILADADPSKIIEAKKAYRKHYLKEYKQRRRKLGLEMLIALTEREKLHLDREARRHKLKLTVFIRKACMAYISQTYVVPNAEQVANIEQMLSICVQEIQAIARSNERRWLNQNWKYDALQQQVEILQNQLSTVLRNPPLANGYKDQNA